MDKLETFLNERGLSQEQCSIGIDKYLELIVAIQVLTLIGTMILIGMNL